MVGWDNRSDFPPIFITLIPGLTFTELRVVSMEHLQRVWLASSERLPFRTPGSDPFRGLAYAPTDETSLTELAISFSRLSILNTLGTFSILLTSSQKPLNGIKRNLTGSTVSLSIFSIKFVFRAGRKTKMTAQASNWLRHFGPFLWNYWTEVDKTGTKAWSQRPLPSLLLTCIEFPLIVRRDCQ